MRRFRRSFYCIAAAIAVLACDAAAATGTVTYRAGSPSRAPYAIVTVANGEVVRVRWAFEEPCAGAYPMPASATNALHARVGRHGRFAKTIEGQSYGSQVTTSFSGTISSTVATVRINDQELIPHYGVCAGSRTFKARRT